MRAYRFTAFAARFMTVVGVALVAGGVVLAVVALVVETPWGSVTGQVVLERVLAAIVLIVSGILAGGPFVVFGQLLLIFLDQRRLLARIDRSLRRGAAPAAPEEQVAGRRLLPPR
jgi:ABC-type phosphate transport system permease subunit